MPLNRQSILIVDDDLPLLGMLEQTFRRMTHFGVLTVSNSREALDACTADTDLVLLDIHLGECGTDGLSVARFLRKIGYKGIICMFTGDPSPIMLFQSILAGANDYILKGTACNIVDEVRRLIKLGTDDIGDCRETVFNPIEESAYFRSTGLSNNETNLLNEFAHRGYPRIKEFAACLNISETCLWKRLARIRDKLQMDSMAQIAHLLTTISMMDVSNEKNRSISASDISARSKG